MTNKQDILNELADIFNRWQVLLASLSQEQIQAQLRPSDWTIKDVVAHLWSWQQASVARMQAALENREPIYPHWWALRAPDPEENVDETNALLFTLSKDKPWSQVYDEWRSQFMHYLELTGKIPEKDFLQSGRYTWMGKYAIVDSTVGSLEHHKEHYETLTRWMREHN